jgi:hypothetical protein
MKIFLISIVIAITSVSHAQDFNTPENVTLKTEDDYGKYETVVIKAINWYHNTPLGNEPAKRKNVSAFLMQWFTGTPSVSIELSQDLVPFMESPECLMSFLAGWTKYSLEHNYSKDKVACATAALEHVIDFYKKNKSKIGRVSSIEKLAKKQKKNKLKSYVESVL